MPITIAVGAQGGDEGKGKIVDYLSEKFDLIVRYSGGDNAGHTVVNNSGIFHLHLVPSGIFNQNADCLIGTGTVVNPDSLEQEIETLKKCGISVDRLYISCKAHILMPYHIAIDYANEKRNGIIDTTKRGIGPAYADRAFRDGIRFEDLSNIHSLDQKLGRIIPRINSMLHYYNQPYIKLEDLKEKCLEWHHKSADRIVEPVRFVHNYLASNRRILFEGQLGLLRDLDLGTYPYVTSSYPSAAYACVSAGIPVFKVDNIIGISRAYPILAGNGPFPTEMDEKTANILRGTGERVDDEYGVTTRRPRRIGWLDLPCLKYSTMINGYSEIALCKLDKLDQFGTVNVCIGYELDGKEIDFFPSTDQLYRVSPKYITLPGWEGDIRSIRKIKNLPRNARNYIKTIEEFINVPVNYVGVGPSRNEIATK